MKKLVLLWTSYIIQTYVYKYVIEILSYFHCYLESKEYNLFYCFLHWVM